MTEITDAGQSRGSEVGKVLKSPLFWGLAVVASAAAGIAGGLYYDPAAGAGAAAAAFIFVMVCGFAYAKAMAVQSFHESYAESRGLTTSKGQLGKLTPLLAQGADQRTDAMMSGPLDQGFAGSLALFTVTDSHLDNQRNETRKDNPFTLVHIELPETAARLPELIVRPRSGTGVLEIEGDLRQARESIRLESQALDDRFEILVARDQDPGFVRQVFSPSFIVWLSEKPPPGFGFELAAGNLVSLVPGYRADKQGFDEMIDAGSTVAARLREEASE